MTLKGLLADKKSDGTRLSFSRLLFFFVVLVVALMGVFYWIVADNWRVSHVKTDPVNGDAALPALEEGMEIRQTFYGAAEQLKTLELKANLLPGREETELSAIVSENGVIIAETKATGEQIASDGTVTIDFDTAIPAGGQLLELTLRGDGALCFLKGETRSAGKFAVEAETTGELVFNGEKVDGTLVMIQRGENTLSYAGFFWPVGLGFLALGVIVSIISHKRTLSGKPGIISRGIELCKRFSFLLKTLVIRDFRVKYKASALGIIWSFLNPMLMTLVYYFVFSTIFRSTIEYFPVYLMSGIVVFNYFSDATNLGMQSVVGNAGLITKVYMPKYILPVSKVLSSAINLVISMIPLFMIMLITGVPFHKSLLLLPMLVVFLIAFCTGVSLILSTVMVFFRDIQFLWSVLLTILNFLSPIFYPESIIPSSFRVLYHCNPLYQYLFFGRSIIIGGVSPTPVTYLYCMLASCLTLILGIAVFRKNQSKFVLHL